MPPPSSLQIFLHRKACWIIPQTPFEVFSSIQLTIPEIRNYFIKALTRPNPDPALKFSILTKCNVQKAVDLRVYGLKKEDAKLLILFSCSSYCNTVRAQRKCEIHLFSSNKPWTAPVFTSLDKKKTCMATPVEHPMPRGNVETPSVVEDSEIRAEMPRLEEHPRPLSNVETHSVVEDSEIRDQMPRLVETHSVVEDSEIRDEMPRLEEHPRPLSNVETHSVVEDSEIRVDMPPPDVEVHAEPIQVLDWVNSRGLLWFWLVMSTLAVRVFSVLFPGCIFYQDFKLDKYNTTRFQIAFYTVHTFLLVLFICCAPYNVRTRFGFVYKSIGELICLVGTAIILYLVAHPREVHKQFSDLVDEYSIGATLSLAYYTYFMSRIFQPYFQIDLPMIFLDMSMHFSIELWKKGKRSLVWIDSLFAFILLLGRNWMENMEKGLERRGGNGGDGGGANDDDDRRENGGDGGGANDDDDDRRDDGGDGGGANDDDDDDKGRENDDDQRDSGGVRGRENDDDQKDNGGNGGNGGDRGRENDDDQRDKDDAGRVNGGETDDAGIVVCHYNDQHSNENEYIKLEVENGGEAQKRKKKGWDNGKGRFEVALNIGVICGAAMIMVVTMARAARR
ncbi:Halomucin [Camellia lanceoleosa]|uniref:Halomucin n=1 Tax=Camellia lanceoleosa TaxID=1840588 RepID=A0ACC0J0F2_9ERIC|nr:Halomucin [Camellia lanceoleosa]